ncbi:MFS transporter [Actinoplanes sp. L3-i22]|uniref:MFS transporter n=1 Tax=Actinoplanes sp. L3-i22 TaxID=2836373 RepID=UPI001C78D9BA|nr:MFS transporter [Actinoplanes sp. L3-i22]BCY12159.1 MFS transporter [Actinoplanes sp. L3-i22]
MTSLWRNRDFNLLWGGQVLSELGDAVAGFAVPLLVLILTGSVVQAGVVATISKITTLVCHLPVGVLADRVDRRRAMLAADGVRLLAGGALAVLIVIGQVRLWVIILVAVVNAAASALFSTTEHAALRSIVPAAELPTAVARNEARGYGVALAGPPLGGVLFGIGHALPFIGNVVSYLASMAGVLLIRGRLQQQRAAEPDRYRAALAEGVSFVVRDPFLRAVLFIAAPLNFAITGAVFTIIVSLQRNGTAPAVIGLIETVLGVGGLVGAVLAPLLQRRLGLAPLARILCLAATGSLLISALLMTSVAAVVPVAVALVIAPAGNAALFGHVAAITPDRMQGRVFSVILLGASSGAAVAPALAGTLVAIGTSTATVLVFAAAMASAAIIALVSRGIRRATPITPDRPAEPGSGRANAESSGDPADA